MNRRAIFAAFCFYFALPLLLLAGMLLAKSCGVAA